MSTYFKNFQEVLASAEAPEAAVVKPSDTGGDVLPFDHLDDRRFEILVYRLKCAELSSTGHRVTLMQGVGERGRDVIVHSPSGDVAQIIQCKKYSERFTAPALRKELIKLALHHYLDPAIIGSEPVVYELWCPGGLTEPAINLLDTWPKRWCSSLLKDDALAVIKTYAAFENINWDSVGNGVVNEFGQIVRPRHVTGIDISIGVRACLPVYEAFFQGNVVMHRADVLDAFRQIASEMTEFAPLSDKDMKHVLDRIASFTPERRFVHTSGYVMGLSPELLSRFNGSEYESFATYAIQGTMGMIQVVLQVCARLVHEEAKQFRESFEPANKNIPLVFAQTLNLSMITRVSGILPLGLKHQPGLAAYEQLSLRERVEHHARELWGQYQRCLAGYDPVVHSVGSDEALRSRIATHGIDGARDQDEFERRLFDAIDEHMNQIETRFRKFMELVPEQILLITDTMTVFENKWLLGRMAECTALLQRLRGSVIIPD